MCLDILYKTITQPVGTTLDYLHEGRLMADLINYLKVKSPTDHLFCALAIYGSYQIIKADGNSHNLRGSIASLETENNNTNFNEVQTSHSEASLSGIVATKPTDHLPSF